MKRFEYRQYVPCLRWKVGEYKAISLLSRPAKELITPLIEAPEKGYDFETESYKKNIEEHLEPFAKRIRQNWGERPCFVDLNFIPPTDRLPDGEHPVDYLFKKLDSNTCNAVPVTALTRDAAYQEAVYDWAIEKDRGLCLRISLDEAAGDDLESSIRDILRSALKFENCDFILDLGAPNFVPLDGFAELVESVIETLPGLQKWRNFVLLGTSFPPNMAEIESNTATFLPRNEWKLYKKLVPMLQSRVVRVPSFGDYAINHPDLLQKDMRLVKPSGTVRYATDDQWLIVKGPNVRDNGYSQYVGHCKRVVGSKEFLGSSFSHGGEYIAKCAAKTASTGNLSTWRRVGTNQHLEKVASDIANLF